MSAQRNVQPIILRGLHADRFEATFAVRNLSGGMPYFIQRHPRG